MGQNLAFPITLAIRFYNSLYYRTNRDSRAVGTLNIKQLNLQITFLIIIIIIIIIITLQTLMFRVALSRTKRCRAT